MQVKAKGKYLRISSKKMRLVTDLIRGMDLKDALDSLNFVPKKSARFINKVLKSALANAEHNFDLKKENLFIKEIFVNEGPTLKRWRPRAFGRAGQVRKRSSHLEIILGEKIPSSETRSVKTKIKEPIIESISKDKIEEKKPVEETEEETLNRLQGKHQSKPNYYQKKGKGFRGSLKKIFRRKTI
ncbi:50S ribosomal protein L22 [Patescibacteria group bacterium]|nr:50S ribosomal protein L22 [Patescibacteria group bacterium]